MPTSNACNCITPRKLQLAVSDESAVAKFTTLLQSGLFLDVSQGDTIGDVLCTLPGFTEEYIIKNVQTIFLNGLPADDLEQQIWGKSGVIAVSAAMPGLAGAIFRKGGVHASLRTATADDEPHSAPVQRPVFVRLKLFNMIAKDRGEEILSRGCVLQASAIQKYLSYRTQVAATINCATSGDQSFNSEQLHTFLDTLDYVHLTINKQV